MIIGYVRVSTIEQNEERQLVTMNKYNVEKIFQEKASAKDTKRPALEEMIDFARDGDTIIIHDFSRLARSTTDLLKLVEFFNEKNINLVSIKENIDFKTPTGKLMLTMIGAINEFERANLLERQREGIALAKKKGKYKGGKRKTVQNFEEHYEKYKQRKINKSELSKLLNISRPTLNKLLKDQFNIIQNFKKASQN